MLNKFQLMQHFKNLIKKQIGNNFKKGTIISNKEIRPVLKSIKSDLNLPKSTKIKDLLNFLVENNIFSTVELRDTTKYLYGEPRRYKTSLSLRKNSYLSHYTALFLHDLTENVPKNIYTNKEQTKKK